MAAVTSNGHRLCGYGTQERGGAAVINRGGLWAGNPLEARRRQLLKTLTHNRHLVEAPG